MKIQADKTQEHKRKTVVSEAIQKQSDNHPAFRFADNRPEAVSRKKLQSELNNTPRIQQLKALQETMHNNSRTQQALQLQATIQSYSLQKTVQRTRFEAERHQEKLSQGGFELIQCEVGDGAQEKKPIQAKFTPAPTENEPGRHFDDFLGSYIDNITVIEGYEPWQRFYQAAEKSWWIYMPPTQYREEKYIRDIAVNLAELRKEEKMVAKYQSEGEYKDEEPEKPAVLSSADLTGTSVSVSNLPAAPEDVKFGFELEFFHPKKTEGIRVKDEEDIQDMIDRGEKVPKGYKEKYNKDAAQLYGKVGKLWIQNLPRLKGVKYNITQEDHKGHGIPYNKILVKTDKLEWWYKPTIDDDVLEIIAQPFSVRELNDGLTDIIQECIFNVAAKLGFQTFKGKEKLAKKPLGNHLNVDMTTAFGNLSNVTKYMRESFMKKGEIEDFLASSQGMKYQDERNASFVDEKLMPFFEGKMLELEQKCNKGLDGYTVADPAQWAKEVNELMTFIRSELAKRENKWDDKMNYQHYMALNAEHIGKKPDPSTWRIEMRTSIMPENAKELRDKIEFILYLREEALKK